MDRQACFNLGFLATLLGLSGMLLLQHSEIRQLKVALAASGAPPSGRPHVHPRKPSPGHPSRQAPEPGARKESSSFAGEPPPSHEQELASLQQQVAVLQEQVTSGTQKLTTGRDPGTLLQDSFFTPLLNKPGPVSAATLKGPTWNHAQATGAPDTQGAGDFPTAWAPKRPQSGEQWLQLGYDSSVEIGAINVLETHNPGALSRVTALMPDGTEKEIWSGTTPPGEAPVETSVPVPPGITSNQIRVYVDTNRVESWPEIDAVELVGKDGSRQWASSSSASSSYH